MRKRIILLWMLFFMLVTNTFVTLSINVAIISMVRPIQEQQTHLNVTKTVTCPNTTFYGFQNRQADLSNSNHQNDKYDWSNYEKRTVLAAYHWLSWLSILPGSVLAQKYGTKVIVGYTCCISAIISSIIPLVAGYGAKFVMYVRMVQGFFSFMAMPGGVMTIVGNWSSSEDRGIFVAVILVGSSFALGFGNYLFGYIGQYLHWKYIFHLTSLCGILWTIIWYFLVYDFPDQHPTISLKEKNKILENNKNKVTQENIPIPWKDIFTSIPFIVCSLMMSGMMWNFYMLITFMPSYINDTYGLDSNQAGIIVGVPLLICGLCAFVFGWFADFFIEKHWMSITNSRKLFALIGSLMASIPLIVMAYTKCNLTVMIICYVLSTVSRSINSFGVEPALIDLSPKFCGVLQGLIGTENEIITLSLAIGMSQLTKLLPTEEFWKVSFLFTAILGIVTSILYAMWGSAETQPWNQGSTNVRNKNVHYQLGTVKFTSAKSDIN